MKRTVSQILVKIRYKKVANKLSENNHITKITVKEDFIKTASTKENTDGKKLKKSKAHCHMNFQKIG